MQWNKYQNFVCAHLDLALCLSEQLETSWRRKPEQAIVERHLDYICVRPWETLDIKNARAYATSDVDKEHNISYTVYAHIEGEEANCSRARLCTDGSSVGEVVEYLSAWYDEYWAKQPNRPLVFDAVVRRCKLMHHTEDEWTINKVSLSFFLFPEGFTA